MFDLANYFFNPYAIPNIIVSTIIFITGLFVFSQNPRSANNIFFFLFCLSLNFWLYGRAIMYCSRNASVALEWAKIFAKFGVVNIAPLVYSFSVHWLGLYREQKKFIIAGFVISTALYVTILATPYGITGVRHYFWGYYPIYGPVCKLFLVFFFTYFLSAFRNFFVEWKKCQDPARRKQIRIVTLAYVISFTGSIDFLPKIINLPLYPFGYLSVFIWTLVLAYAIVRYRTLDIQTVIHKTLMWFASTLVAIAPFALMIFLSLPWIERLPQAGATAFYLAALLCFYFYFGAIQPRLDHIFRRRYANLENVMTEFSSELVHLKNLRDLLQNFARLLRRTLYAKQIAVYLQSRSGEELVPAIAKGLRGLKPLSMMNPFLRWLEKSDRVVIADLLQTDPEMESLRGAMAEYFEQTGAVVVVPLIIGGSMIGVVHLGAKADYRKYSPEEIHFLSQIKAPVTIAFSNSVRFIEMQENLQNWNEELEKKVVERTNQLQQTQAQLVQAEKLATIGTLAGGIAHEINNPLTAVLTNAQILKMGAQGEDMESLGLIEEGAKRCQVIIQKLMKYARKPMGQEIMGQVDINKVIHNAVAFLDYQLKQENVDLVIHPAVKLMTVEGNANELEQVVTNLILNAKDAVKMTKHDGKIEVKTAEWNGSVGIIVTDNGVGIPKENLAKIFDPFFTTKEVGKGTGLGLAVTYGIVQKHHGRIEVESQQGKGSQFKIIFPKVLT